MSNYDEIAEGARKIVFTAIAEQREEIITAFVAKYGLQPEECEQVLDFSNYANLEIRWSIKKKEVKK